MIVEMAGRVVVSWKNSPSSEDEPGQRILMAHSTDARRFAHFLRFCAIALSNLGFVY